MQREPLYFGGVMSFEAVWKGLREQDMAVIFGVLVGMLVLDVSNLSVKKLLLDLFCGVGSGAENFIVPVFPNSEAEISEVSDEGWSQVCNGIFVMEVRKEWYWSCAWSHVVAIRPRSRLPQLMVDWSR